jgi:flagellum-specific peptidoglycan hydrolase FlgJ
MLDTQRANLRLIARAAVASEKATGCPAALQAAQCILETGWLSHAPGNNCFGIKSYAGESGRQLLRTREWLSDPERERFVAGAQGRTAELVEPLQRDARGRTLYSVMDWFATFPTLGDCFATRAAAFRQGEYAALAAAWQANGDTEALVRGIAAIYATDPTYAGKVLALIRHPAVQAAIAAARAEVSA